MGYGFVREFSDKQIISRQSGGFFLAKDSFLGKNLDRVSKGSSIIFVYPKASFPYK